MKGRNILMLNQATINEAIEEYLNARLSDVDVKVEKVVVAVASGNSPNAKTDFAVTVLTVEPTEVE